MTTSELYTIAGLTLACSLYALWLLGAYAVGRSIREDMETDDDDQS